MGRRIKTYFDPDMADAERAQEAKWAKSVGTIDDIWHRRATDAAIEACRKIIKDGTIPAGTPIGRLGPVEWGWIASAALMGWIVTRSQQAVAEHIDTERAMRVTGLEPEPWAAGVVATILPDLAEIPGFDFSVPLSEWPRESMINFLLAATRLIREAESAVDRGDGITRKPVRPADL
jgi:hypothetical protein